MYVTLVRQPDPLLRFPKAFEHIARHLKRVELLFGRRADLKRLRHSLQIAPKGIRR
ncbi:histidine kinase [Rhizobium sp. F40D2]